MSALPSLPLTYLALSLPLSGLLISFISTVENPAMMAMMVMLAGCAAGFFTPFQFGAALEAVNLPHNPAIMNELQPLFKRGKDGAEKCGCEAFEVPFPCTTIVPLQFYYPRLSLSLAHLSLSHNAYHLYLLL